MNKTLKVGGWTRTRDGLVLAAMFCLLMGWARATVAQSANSPATNSPAPMPATTSQPQIPPPATAPSAASPATPSMMPRVPGTQLDRVVAIVNDDLILDSD